MNITDLLDDDCRIMMEKVKTPESNENRYLVKIAHGNNVAAQMLHDYDFEDLPDFMGQMYLRLKQSVRKNEPSIPIQWINDKLEEWSGSKGKILTKHEYDAIRILLFEWERGN